MSGFRGAARKGKVKIRVTVSNTNRKLNGFQTHIFLPEGYNWHTVNAKLLKKFGSETKWGWPRRVVRGYSYPDDRMGAEIAS